MRVYKVALAVGVVGALTVVVLLRFMAKKPVRAQAQQALPEQGGGATEERQGAAKEEEDRALCVNHYLRWIDAAKEQWALANGKENGDLVVEAEVNAYIKAGGPKCPAGGTYTYGRIGELPRCSVSKHVLVLDD